MYLGITNKTNFERNKNIEWSYCCKVLNFLYQLMSKIYIKRQKTLEKFRKSLGGGKGFNQTENLVLNICNREMSKLILDRCGSWGWGCGSWGWGLNQFCFHTTILDINYPIQSAQCFLKGLKQQKTIFIRVSLNTCKLNFGLLWS